LSVVSNGLPSGHFRHYARDSNLATEYGLWACTGAGAHGIFGGGCESLRERRS
jgi:hypothetical protein